MARDEYAALLSRLLSARRFGARLELTRIAGVLGALDHPQRRIGRVVAVGGTNGKGSTVAFLEALAAGAGLRAGAFSSPHLSNLAERFRIDGEPAARSAIVDAAHRVEAADRAGTLTFFERVTAIALCVFAAAETELCVLEVGLGGRFDATNAVDSAAAVVTGVALDHTEHLGDTLEAIAGEKAGIFREGRPAVIGRSGESAGVDHLVARATERGCDPVRVIADGALRELRGVDLGLPGSYQVANAAAAVAALRALDVPVRLEALAGARLPGRLETVAREPRTIVDGAHNGHAARALVAELPDAPIIAVLGASAGKDLAAIVGPIAARARAVIATQSRQDRAAPASAVADAAGPDAEIVCGVGPAIERARQLAGPGDVIVVAGSLFVAGEAREHVLGIAPDPVLLSDPPAIP